MQRAGRTVSEANESDQAGDADGIRDAQKSRVERLIRWTGPVLLVLVAGVPLFRRLRHPTLQGDDLIRIVDLIEQPCRELLFLPLAEHVAPLFQIVSWMTWQLIGHDIRLAPLAFCFASVAAWCSVFACSASGWCKRRARAPPRLWRWPWWHNRRSSGKRLGGIPPAVFRGQSLEF